jgi:hypothetical protein
LARRAARRRYFRRRDARVQLIRQSWEKIVSGEIPAGDWFFDPIDHDIVERITLDRIEIADVKERRCLLNLIRRSGLLDQRILGVRNSRGWSKRQAILALGRMRTPESIPALVEALTDSHDEVVVDAIRGLGQVGTPKAAEAILQRLSMKPVQCPLQTVQTALIHCYRIHAQTLLGKVLEADDVQRPILARVLAEVATRRTSGDLLLLTADPLAEVRASMARVLAVARPHYALNALSRLAADEEWFVRLRAVLAIGELGERRGVPVLISALCDSNRLVRLRAASALVRFEGDEAYVLQLAMRTGDRYALQALVSEMERSGRIPDLVRGLSVDARRPVIESALRAALEGGSVRILTDLLLNHSDHRVRGHLARLMARSGSSALLQHLEQVEATLTSRRQKRLLRWLIANLREAEEGMGVATVAVAV